MSQLRAYKGFYIKAYNVPINSVKTAYFNRLKYRFPSILLTQTTDDEKMITALIILKFKTKG